jgi:hypothetical protein
VDLDEEEVELSSKSLAIAIYYSQKSYSPKVLFSEMLTVWGIPKLAVIDKLGDYCFKLECVKEEEKATVLEGDLWRHKLG